MAIEIKEYVGDGNIKTIDEKIKKTKDKTKAKNKKNKRKDIHA